MKVITAIEDYKPSPDDICVFLAGGITNCWEWQKELIKELKRNDEGYENLVVFNPRRDDFPIGDPNASREQIGWEFKWLERMDIFSMYFCNDESDQPICMYELGRNIVRMQMRFPTDWQKRILVACEDGYKRENDVHIQTGLAVGHELLVYTGYSVDALIKYHARKIKNAYLKVKWDCE